MKPSEIKLMSKLIMESGEIPLLWGHFGIGKTDIVKEIAKETGKELIILVISQMEPGDLIGMPSKDTETGKTVFLKPDWWPSDPNTIIMIDEVNRAHRSIRNAIMQLLLDRRIHNHILPQGTWIVAAANPPDEEYDQVDLITDPAFMSRFFHLEISPDVENWLEWADENSLDKNITQFIKKYPEYLSSDTRVAMRLSLRPSPRSWHKLSNVFSKLSDENKQKYGYILASSIVGSEAARTFLNSINSVTTLPTAEEILKYGKFIDRVERLNQEEKISIILRINKYIENIDERELIDIINNGEHKTFARNIKELSKFVPKDSIFAILRNLDNLVEKNGGIKKAFYDKFLEELAIILETVI